MDLHFYSLWILVSVPRFDGRITMHDTYFLTFGMSRVDHSIALSLS